MPVAATGGPGGPLTMAGEPPRLGRVLVHVAAVR
jgi:hypothetical protein